MSRVICDIRVLALRAGFAVALVACGSTGESGTAPPSAEFLLAAGDSTFWVQSGDEGVRVRSAPILLTQVGAAFYELFIAEDGVDYADAGFAMARMVAREVTRTDTVVLFDDGSVMREAEAWKRRHPGEEAIDPDNEELPADPATMVTEEIEILDVHGPWVTFNHLLDVDVADSAPHRHVGKRHVVDVRTGVPASLELLFGAEEARRLVAAGRGSFVQLTDSIRAAGDGRAELARETLDSFRFDSTSFGLTDIGREPAVAFLIPGNGVDGEALALNLPPIAAKAPAWWRAVTPTLPTWSADSAQVRWSRKGYDVLARPTDDGDALSLWLVSHVRGNASEWPVATVPAPAYQMVPLDVPSVTPVLRAALARAFDESSAIDGGIQVASRATTRVDGTHRATGGMRVAMTRPRLRPVHLRVRR